MSQTNDPAVPLPNPNQFDLDALEKSIARSTAFAWLLVAGLPAAGVVASVAVGLPLFAALLAGSFLVAAALVGRRAAATFTGKALRLLVAGRLVLVLALAALLLCASGSAWAAAVSGVLLWLVTDRLLGRRALYDLWKLARGRS